MPKVVWQSEEVGDERGGTVISIGVTNFPLVKGVDDVAVMFGTVPGTVEVVTPSVEGTLLVVTSPAANAGVVTVKLVAHGDDTLAATFEFRYLETSPPVISQLLLLDGKSSASIDGGLLARLVINDLPKISTAADLVVLFNGVDATISRLMPRVGVYDVVVPPGQPGPATVQVFAVED
jgi:hypothetical protein